ncbi:MAG: response regulator transcription factor [Solirubrobacteraceae bacterium]
MTVVIARLDSLLRRGLADALGEDPRIRVLASELGHAQLEQAVTDLSPKVAILDGSVEQALLARVKASRPRTGVVVLVRDPEALFGTLVVAAGATCVAQSTGSGSLRAAVHLAAEGERVFIGAEGQHSSRPYPVGAESLTERELEIFPFLSVGRSYREIAALLDIGVATVRSHAISICRKLRVGSKRELIGMQSPPPLPEG